MGGRYSQTLQIVCSSQAKTDILEINCCSIQSKSLNKNEEHVLNIISCYYQVDNCKRTSKPHHCFRLFHVDNNYAKLVGRFIYLFCAPVLRNADVRYQPDVAVVIKGMNVYLICIHGHLLI